MRRVFVLALAIVTAHALMVVPGSAAPAVKTTHELVECLVAQDQQPDAVKFTGQNGKIWHVRGAENFSVEWMWNGSSWVEAGTNDIVANWNARYALIEVPGVGPIPVPTEASVWGDFSLESSSIGDFAGSWAWGDWPTGLGHGAGKGVGHDEGTLAKVTLSTADPGWGDGNYPCPQPTFVTVELIDTAG